MFRIYCIIVIMGIVTTSYCDEIVANEFIPNIHNKRTVNHIDGNKLNNHVDNLEWVTDKENCIHAELNNLRPHPKGSNHHMSIINEKDVIEIRTLRMSGLKLKEIGVKFGIAECTVSAICNKRIWKHIN